MDDSVDDRRVIRRVIGCILFVCLLCFPAEGAHRVPSLLPVYEGPVTVWHIPHPDDETIGMAGAMVAERLKGRRNVVVFYTEGGSSDVRHVINGLFYCALHETYHDPEAEGYAPLTVAEFQQARMAETIDALQRIGVAETDVISLDFVDGEVEVERAYEVMKAIDAAFDDVAHRTTALKDHHRDHRSLARALLRLYDERHEDGVHSDIQLYSVYAYGMSDDVRMNDFHREPVVDFALKRQALHAFSLWRPSDGRFAIGMHSVSHLFEQALHDPFEYVEPIPHPIKHRHIRTFEKSGVIFHDRAALNVPLHQRWSFRMELSYRDMRYGTTLLYRFPTVSGNVHVYVGATVTDAWNVRITPGIIGFQLADRFVLEYALEIAERRRHTIRFGFKIRL